MLFAILAAVGVYLLVPRGIGIGEVQLQSDHMSWNTTRGTYQLKLLAKIPIYNPNYMQARGQTLWSWMHHFAMQCCACKHILLG